MLVQRASDPNRADVEMNVEHRVVLAAELFGVPALAVGTAIEPELEAIGRLALRIQSAERQADRFRLFVVDQPAEQIRHRRVPQDVGVEHAVIEVRVEVLRVRIEHDVVELLLGRSHNASPQVDRVTSIQVAQLHVRQREAGHVRVSLGLRGVHDEHSFVADDAGVVAALHDQSGVLIDADAERNSLRVHRDQRASESAAHQTVLLDEPLLVEKA